MKVVQINAVYEYSSTGRTTTELHEYLRNNGVDSYVFCCNKSIPNKNVFKIGCNWDFRLHSILSHLLGLQGFFSFFSTKRMLRHLDKIKPDVVHLRVLHSNCVNLPLLLKYLAKRDIATVITLHDCWFFTGHCCYFIDSNCDKWRNKCGNCPDLKNWNRSWFFDNTQYILKTKKELFEQIKNLTVVGVSDWVTSFIPYSILKEAKRIIRIYNWVDVNKFKPLDTTDLRKKLDLEDKFVILGVAQNWYSTKGLKDFISVAKINPAMRFVLVGNIVTDETLPENIISVGVLSDVNELVSFYSMADVFFNPSIRETFGKVTIEALSCGTPVVVYNVTASPELVKSGCGYAVEKQDIETVSIKLNEIQEKGKSLYERYCRNFVVENFSEGILQKDYLNLYKLISE